MMVSVVKNHRNGTPERGRDLFDAYLPLARFEQQPGLGLAIRKHVLAKRGVIAHATQRRPGAALSAAGVAEVELLMGRLERRLAELG
jgi:4-hydroxy-tetrahydrodipicolinate synthase